MQHEAVGYFRFWGRFFVWFFLFGFGRIFLCWSHLRLVKADSKQANTKFIYSRSHITSNNIRDISKTLTVTYNPSTDL